MELFSFFGAAILMIVALVGIHCYLGIHVLKREVIFIDLSLAQLAALGYVVGEILGHEMGTTSSYLIALGHTFLGALLFSYCKKIKRKISQESLIGITYAFGSSVVILLLNSAPHGMEHFKEILVGKLLWVDYHDVLKVVIIYSVVGIIYGLKHKIFIKLSDHESNFHSMTWDFIFYALFGVVITSSVGNAGILLVFSLLVGPALITKTISQKFSTQLLSGWGLGVILCAIGLAISYKFDYPVGATIVAVIALVNILYTLWLATFKKS